jgi:c-di-GMP-binding flagellar brake protein YcgR
MMNRRQYERIELPFPCRVTSAVMNGYACEGAIENISRGGVLFRVSGISNEKLPMTGDVVALEVLLPERRSFGQKTLRCRGNVVRVVMANRETRIAMSISYMTFQGVRERGRAKTGERAWNQLVYRA